MAKKSIDIKEQRIAGIASIKGVFKDLETAFFNKETEIEAKVISSRIELERIKGEVEDYKLKINAWKDRIKEFEYREADIKLRENRVKETEDILEEEKKLITSKKQHLIEWEGELTLKARRLNG